MFLSRRLSTGQHSADVPEWQHFDGKLLLLDKDEHSLFAAIVFACHRKRVPLYNGHMGVTARASYAGGRANHAFLMLLHHGVFGCTLLQCWLQYRSVRWVNVSPSHAGVLAPGFQLRPTFGFEYELGGGAAIFAGNQFNLRHQFRLSRGLGVEVRQPPTFHFSQLCGV